MLIIPLYDICKADQLLKSLLSDGKNVKVAEFDAENIPAAPYVVYQIINAQTQQYLDKKSDMDDLYVQIDVYAAKKDVVRRIAKLLRNAIEEDYCYIESFTGTERDAETNLYRIRIDTSWFEEN